MVEAPRRVKVGGKSGFPNARPASAAATSNYLRGRKRRKNDAFRSFGPMTDNPAHGQKDLGAKSYIHLFGSSIYCVPRKLEDSKRGNFISRYFERVTRLADSNQFLFSIHRRG